MSKEIPLTSGMVAVVDDANFERLSKHRWHLHKGTRTYYARTNVCVGRGNYKPVYMHRMILDGEAIEQVDHINGDGLDNRSVNLRVCSKRENMRNRRPNKNSSSAFKGIHWDGRDKRWQARIRVNGNRMCLGSFRNEEEAAIAYDNAAREYHGEFARVNFVPITG